MNHVFVWTIGDIFGAAVLMLIALMLTPILLLMAYLNLKEWLIKKFSSTPTERKD